MFRQNEAKTIILQFYQIFARIPGRNTLANLSAILRAARKLVNAFCLPVVDYCGGSAFGCSRGRAASV
jgi:hypothetical protein